MALLVLTNDSATRIMTPLLSFKTVLLALICFSLYFQFNNLEGQTLRINEFMAANSEGILDEDGDASDWIEIWNYGPTPVSLEGLTMTDDSESPDLWSFPAIHLDANDYLIVFASGKDRRFKENELHCNFELDRKGEFLSLNRFIDEEWVELSEFKPFPAQRRDISYGSVGNENSISTAHFLTPSPGARNRGNSVSGFVKDTRFSINRGYYKSPFELLISTETKGATLAYTTNGTIPTPTNGTQVPPTDARKPTTLQLSITDSILVRAMAYKEGFFPTNVDTHSYLFHASLLEQGDDGEPFDQSVRWGHAEPDWEMDPTIVQHGNSEIRPSKEDFLRLPTLSVAMNFDEMFGNGGIYIAGQSVEKVVSAEWINPNADPQSPNEEKGFQTDGTIQIVGGSSPNRWKSDKLSLRLKFDQDLEYPIFGDEATDRFDTLVIDARLNNVWHYGGGVEPGEQQERAQYVRDQYAANLHNAMGGTSPHGKHAHVMINGIYWGIHTIHERPDDNFAASYLGGPNEDYDSIKHTPNDVLSGSSNNYNQLHSLAGRDLSTQENYAAVSSILDIDDFIGYMLMNYYIGNGDWAHHNWYASFNRVDPNGKWRFHSWDAEKGLHSVNNNVTGRNDQGGPTFLQHQLIRNESYRLRFADLAYEHLRYGTLNPEQAARLYREISNPIDLPIRLESARWGDNQKTQPYTRLDWVENRDSLFGLAQNRQLPTHDYFNRRSDIVLNQFRQRNWLPSMEPPVFNQHGGHISGQFEIQIESTHSGSVLFTLDGSDPMPANQNFNQTTFNLISEPHEKRAIIPTDNTVASTWMQMSFNDTAWPKGNMGAGYENSSGYEDFISTPLNFEDEVDRNNTETIYMRVNFEVEDATQFDRLSLGMRYEDGFVAYLNGEEIARANAPGNPNSLVAWNGSASSSHSDSEAIIFQTFDVTSSLEYLQAGSNVLAIHGLNVSATSSDFLIWPILNATSIEEDPASPANDNVHIYEAPLSLSQSTTINARMNRAGEWSPLLSAHFIVDASPVTAANLTLSAIHYHPSASTEPELNAGFLNRRDFEFLELRNTSIQTVNLNGLRFTSGIDFELNELSLANELAPGEVMFLVSNQEAFELRFGNTWNIAGSFKNNTHLNNGGERIAAVNSAGNIVLDVTYSDQTPWPSIADGQGAFLTLLIPQGQNNPNQASSWISTLESSIRNPSDASTQYRLWLATYFSVEALNDSVKVAWAADPDLDGINNLLEYFHGSNPSSSTHSVHWLQIEKNIEDINAEWQIEFTKVLDVPGIDWSIEYSSDLRSWTNLPNATPTLEGDRQHYSWTQPNSELARFFRLKLTLLE